MTTVENISQPNLNTTMDAIKKALTVGKVYKFDASVAYITSSGIRTFVGEISRSMGDDWSSVSKRWLTSFDYCRTEPAALSTILETPNTEVRIYDAEFCLNRKGTPRIPFHPKTFLVSTSEKRYAISGSGNMSRSGLMRGIEAGFSIAAGVVEPATSSAELSITGVEEWFQNLWVNASVLDANLLQKYKGVFNSWENLSAPAPTEDDTATSDTSSNAISSKNLKKIRACNHFWTQSGNVTRNRGPNLPGNQLMMKRLSRVFFGFSPDAVPENTQIGDVYLKFRTEEPVHCSLTYSDNKMDKLVLPIPGAGGPARYDQTCIHFEKVGAGSFVLSVEPFKNYAKHKKKSALIEGAFQMQSGREWGVY